MTLRARLVLVLGTLLALLIAAEWSLVRALTRDLDQEVDVVALSVGSSMLSLFGGPAAAPAALPAGGPEAFLVGAARTAEHHGRVVEQHVRRARRAVAGDEHEVAIAGDLEVLVLSEEPPGTGDPAPGQERRFLLRVGSQVTDLPVGGGFGRVSVDWQTQVSERELAFDTSPGALPVGAGVVAVARPLAAPAPPDEPALRIPVPRRGLDRALDAFLSKLLLGSLVLFVVGLGAIGWVAHRVTRPLRGLAGAAARVGRGELGAVALEHGDREVAATLRAFNDMSRRLAALDAEARSLRDRQHLGELGDVARGLAHALRNPLHTLGLAVDALAHGRDDARGTAVAARTQIQRIDGALEGFLTLAGSGGARDEVALDDLARDVALELAQSTRPVAVRVLAEGGPVPITCVPAELRAVVHALVVNAAEAAPGEPVVVRVETVQDGARARLEVLDRGPGLPPGVRERLFTPHVTTKAHGTGMGLYLAERIARTRYGGSLALLDRPGGGLRAVLEVDRDAADREPAEREARP